MKKSIKLGLVCGLLFANIPFILVAQSNESGPFQQVRGEVRNTLSEERLTGVVVQLFTDTDSLSSVTDSLGEFLFKEIPVGRVQLSFNLLGFKSTSLKGVLVEAGRETIVSADLLPTSADLDEVVVTAKLANDANLAFSSITPEQIQRFPNNFFDPGRFVTQYPGFTNDNDQGNSISVRGASPGFFQWRLEGIEIVNPNHTANAGTFNDRATPGAGGLNMLSAEVAGSSMAYKGLNTDIRFGNSIGGIMDMKYRKGNPNKFEKSARVGLLGLEAVLEGPLSKESNASYLIHYRYSFVGLLSAFGVDFGDEDIRFQDLSFSLNLPSENLGQFSLFGVGGTSSNEFVADPASKETPLEKDFQTINFDSRTGIIGLKHVGRFGKSGAWNTRVGWSVSNSDRFGATSTIDSLAFQLMDTDTIKEQKLFASTYINWNDLDDDYFKVGFSFLQRTNTGAFSVNRAINGEERYNLQSFYDQQYHLLRLFGNWTKTFGPQWEASLGFNVAYFVEGEELFPELRLYAKYISDDGRHSWKAGYQAFSQLAPVEASTVFTKEQDGEIFPLMKTESISLDYHWKVSNDQNFFASAYHKVYYNLPQSVDPNFGFSTFNQLERYRIESSAITDEGSARTYGLEFALRKMIIKDWYYIASATAFRSFYTNAKGTEFPSQFDRKYSLSGTLGREWVKRNTEAARTRIIGASIRPVLIGGLGVAPIDEGASAQTGITIFDYSDGYTEHLPAYFRVDFQFSISWNKPEFSQRLSLDIHNISNQKNLAFYYFDQIQQEVVERHQLGLIPVISYRFSF